LLPRAKGVACNLTRIHLLIVHDIKFIIHDIKTKRSELCTLLFSLNKKQKQNFKLSEGNENMRRAPEKDITLPKQ